MKRVEMMKILAGVMAAVMIASLPVNAMEQPEDTGVESAAVQTEAEEAAMETSDGAAADETGNAEPADAKDPEAIPEAEPSEGAEASAAEETSASENSGEAAEDVSVETSDTAAVQTAAGESEETEAVAAEVMDAAAKEAAVTEAAGEVNLKKAVTVNAAVWQPFLIYNKTMCNADGMKQPAADLLRDGESSLEEGVHYTVSYKNNKKVGTAKVTFTGLGKYTGSFTKTFKIKPDKDLKPTAPEKIIYSKGGAVPIIEVRDKDGEILTAGKEYAVKFTNNKKCGEASYKVTGKGNYKGASVTGSFTVLPANLETDCRITVNNKIYKNKKNSYKAVPVLYDNKNDKKLKAGVDYEKAILYQKKQGDTYREIASDEIPELGSRIRVTVKGTGNYTGSAVAEYRITGENNEIISSVMVTPGGLNLALGETAQLQVSVPSAEDDEWTVAFSSENPAIAAVDGNGAVTAVGKGMTAVIATVTDLNGNVSTGSCKVFVDMKVVVLEATPNDGKNDTDEFNAAIREVSSQNSGVSEEDRTILWVPEGVYHINVNDEYKKIEVKSNVTIMMDDNAVLQALPSSKQEYYMVWIAGAENVIFSGGKVIGDRNIHKGKSGEGGHCMAVLESKNVTIENVDVSGGWGDGIYVGIYSANYGKPERYVKDVYIRNCNVHNNRRNNIAITNGDNINISNCKLKNHSNNEGLCIETNKDSVPVTNVHITDCEISGKGKEAAGVPRPAKNVTFKKCTIRGDFYNGGCGGLVFDSCLIDGELTEWNHTHNGTIRKAKLINTNITKGHTLDPSLKD